MDETTIDIMINISIEPQKYDLIISIVKNMFCLKDRVSESYIYECVCQMT